MGMKSMYFLPLALSVAACGPESTITSSPDGPQPRDARATPGGGTKGGPITDALTVFVIDDSGEPVKGATVIIEHALGQSEKRTTAGGRVDFFGQDKLESAFATHVFHPDYRYASWIGANASVQTIVLAKPLDAETDPVSFETATGSITGWSRLKENTEQRTRLAAVFPIAAEPIVDAEQRPRPGTVMPDNPDGTDYNIAINGEDPFPSWPDYELRYDTRADRLAVYGGVWTLDADPPMEWTHIGLSGETMGGDLELRHALDQQLDVVAPETFEVTYGVDLGYSVLTLMDNGAPSLFDDLADAEYLVSVRSDDEQSAVFAERRGRGTHFTFDRMLAPPGPVTAAARSIAAEPSDGASWHRYEIGKSWQVTVFGDDSRSVTLPKTPDGIEDPLYGPVEVTVRAEDLGNVDLQEARFDELAPLSTAMSWADLEL